MNKFIPLISPKHITEFTPSEYHEYIKNLWIDPNKDKPAPKYVSFRRNDKGTPIVTVRSRKPKYVTTEEFLELCFESEMKQSEMFLFLKSKKVHLVRDEKAGKELSQFEKEIPW